MGSGKSGLKPSSIEKRLEGYSVLRVGLAFSLQIFCEHAVARCPNRLPPLHCQCCWHQWAVGEDGWPPGSSCGLRPSAPEEVTLRSIHAHRHHTPYLRATTELLASRLAELHGLRLEKDQNFQMSLKQTKKKKRENRIVSAAMNLQANLGKPSRPSIPLLGFQNSSPHSLHPQALHLYHIFK